MLIAIACVNLGHAGTVWREGESPDASDVQPHGWYDGVQKDLLSGGAWLSNFGPREGTARYNIDVPSQGQHTLWLRANPVGAALSWRFDGQPWQSAPLGQAQHRVNVARDGAVDIRFLAWVELAELPLDAGPHTLEIRFHSNNQNHGAIDAIFLTDEGLAPVGKGNPAIEGQKHAEGFFAWSPGKDPLRADSPIDLRYLNEPAAGIHGFVRRQNDRFVLGDGSTVRFWAIQDGLGDNPALYQRQAQRMAKYGVNLVRMGGGQFFRLWREDRDRFRTELDDLHRRVHALKQSGIYTYIDHLYWHTHDKIDASVFPGFGEGEHAIALLFFSPEFQQLYLQFLTDLMNTPNPHTGLAMAKDPAVAFLEIQNESSLLFYTFDPKAFPNTERELVESQFATWLIEKYGSLSHAAEAWGDQPRAGNPTPDAFAEQRAGLYSAGMLSGADWARNQRNSRRAGDQLQFMVEAQHRFYQHMCQQLREQVGTQQLIVPSNWKTADPQVLDGLERYTYTGADVICRNVYFGVDYKRDGQNRFYEVEVGDTYRDQSALRSPGKPSPLGTPWIADFPCMITENNWTRPNRYRVEWPWLVATYAQMQGVDGWTFFAKDPIDWRHSMGVWDVSNPSVWGQFPAAALVYRRGDVRQPQQRAVTETISLDNAYQMQGTTTVPLRGEDALWQSRLGGNDRGVAATSPIVSPLAYFIGPVLQRFVTDKTASATDQTAARRLETIALDDYIDTDNQRVRSVTGELSWDARLGVMTVNTPKVQGAWGFLADTGPIELNDLQIDCQNAYGAVIAVALDDKPLQTSQRILIQTGSWDRPYGYSTEPNGSYRRISQLGGYPLNVELIRARVTLRTACDQAIILDGNGYPTDTPLPLEQTEKRTTLTLPQNAIYTILQTAP